jgi:Fanconi-associated nuclease 1
MPEIKQISKTLKFKKIRMNSTKAQFITAILESIQSQPSLFQMNFFKKTNTKQANSLESKIIKDCLKFTGQLVKVNERAWKFFNLVNRVFTRFGDGDSQHVMSTSVRAKIGLLQYMNYQITRSNQVFSSRKCLLEFEEAWNNFQAINEYFHTGSPSQTLFQAICDLCAPIHESWKTLLERDYSNYSTNYFLKFTPGMVYTRAMTLYAASLSRLKKYKEEEAVLLDLLGQDIFRQNKRGVWWTRLCLIQATHLSKSDDTYLQIAYESCVKALEEKVNNGIDSGSANAIYHRMIKLESKLKLEDNKRSKIKDPRPPIAPVITLYGSRVEASGYGEGFKPLWRIVETDELVSVEQFALHNLTKDGWKGYHSENTILTTLFALLFLDILFSPKPGAFETRFQVSPLDLGSEAFYIDRKKEIESRFEDIRNGGFESLITKHYEDNYAKKPSILGLNWQFELKDILDLSKCIGGESLSLICLPFCKDYFSYSSGMPDLW